MTLALRYAVRSDVGLLREGNEDSAYAGPHLLAVADGMGGYEAGEVASAAVISTVAPLDKQPMPESELIDALSGAVTTAKQALRRIVEADPAVGSMGTTLTAMLWADGSAAICHIGDSRAYLVRDGDLYQITHDHTFVQALIDQGRIRPDEASTHPQRSLLLRALDGRTDADPDLSMMSAQVGDRYLICSDGLPVAATDDQILQTLVSVPEPADAVLALIDLAIKGGAPDNVTVIVADVIDLDDARRAPTKAPVVVGAAAANSTGKHDTRPFSLPDLANTPGITSLGTIQGTSSAPQSAPGDGMLGRASGSHSSQPRRTATLPSARHAAVADEEDAPPAPSRRRRWPLMTSIIALFVILLGGGAFIAHQVINSQYYVGIRGGKVVIFRGLDQKLLGLSLSNVYVRTGIPASGITSESRQAIQHAPSSNLAQATHFVANIRKGYNGCQAAYQAVRTWEAHKPKPRKVTVRKNGKLVTETVTPKYRPKPPIPTDCPPMPAH
jgi:PPM family protein phosphatase